MNTTCVSVAVCWTYLLAAQKDILFIITFVIVPRKIFFAVLQTVFSSSGIAWFSLCPESEVPGSAVRPFPDALFSNITASEQNLCKVFFYRSQEDEAHRGIRGNRGEVAPLLLAEVLCSSPVLLRGGPEVAEVLVPLPTSLAVFHIGIVDAAF